MVGSEPVEVEEEVEVLTSCTLLNSPPPYYPTYVSPLTPLSSLSTCLAISSFPLLFYTPTYSLTFLSFVPSTQPITISPLSPTLSLSTLSQTLSTKYPTTNSNLSSTNLILKLSLLISPSHLYIHSVSLTTTSVFTFLFYSNFITIFSFLSILFFIFFLFPFSPSCLSSFPFILTFYLLLLASSSFLSSSLVYFPHLLFIPRSLSPPFCSLLQR